MALGMTGKPWKTWEQMDHAIAKAGDAQAAGAFVHPGDALDAKERGEIEAPSPLPPVRRALGEIFGRMMVMCLPPRSYGDERRWVAGYRRMCAFCYRVSPEVFEGATGEEIAAMLGITRRAWVKQLEYVDAILAGREPKALPQSAEQ